MTAAASASFIAPRRNGGRRASLVLVSLAVLSAGCAAPTTRTPDDRALSRAATVAALTEGHAAAATAPDAVTTGDTPTTAAAPAPSSADPSSAHPSSGDPYNADPTSVDPSTAGPGNPLTPLDPTADPRATAAESDDASSPGAGSLPRRPRRGARLASPLLTETSGLAVSRRDPAILWAINDSGNAPLLHALSRQGARLGEWSVPVPNRDWEDLASLLIDGDPWLVIADTGDNRRRHEEYALHLIPEPRVASSDSAATNTLAVLRTVRFRYEDGAHDVEALGVDPSTLTAWLLVKEAPLDGVVPASGVYTLSLAADADGQAVAASRRLRVARRVTTLAEPGRSIEARFAIALAGVDLEQATAFDIASDNTSACLLSYRHLRCFQRADGEDWSEALARPGRSLGRHGLAQAEALALSPDGLAWTTSEGAGAPLITRSWRARSGSRAAR